MPYFAGRFFFLNLTPYCILGENGNLAAFINKMFYLKLKT